MQFAHRFVEKTGKYKKSREIAQVHRACQDIARPNCNDQQDAQRPKQIHRGAIDRPNLHHHQSRVPQSVARSVEARMLFALAHKTFDLADAGKVVVQKRVHV